LPDLGENDVLIDVAYAGVNFLDIHQRVGRYPRPLPFIPGNEGSGRALAVGRAVRGIAPGDRVAFAMHAQGSYAERVVVNAERVAPVPGTVTLRDAAGLVLQGITALCLVDEARVRSGDTVLVHSASGGAGAAIVQIARRVGARVLGLVSTPEKGQLALAAGAHAVACYDEHDGRYSTWVDTQTRGIGADAAFDAVGGAAVVEDLASLARRGRLVLYGQTAGPFAHIEPSALANRSLSVSYLRVSAFLTSPEDFRGLAARLFELATEYAIAPASLNELPAEQADDAHRALTDRTSTGKTVLRFRGE
jgi:NADPH2:quinone reductase